MQRHIDTTTQLDLIRQDAAARQRRAATYRFVHAERPAHTGRRTVTTTVLAAALSLGIVSGAFAEALGGQPVQQGYEAGLPDGWFVPNEPTVKAADDEVRPASAPTVKVAGVVHGITTGRVPRNVR